MIVMGLDISLNCTGICILSHDRVEYHTEIIPVEYIEGKTTKGKKVLLKGLKRQLFIVNQIELILDLYKPDYVAIENYSFGSKGRAVIQLGELGGIIRFLLTKRNINFQTFSPQTLKSFALGHLDLPKRINNLSDKEKGVARKESKSLMLREAIASGRVKFRTDNSADAYWLSFIKLCIEKKKIGLDVVKLNDHQKEIIERWKNIEPEEVKLREDF